jgi:hypothetical protein
MGNPLRSTRPPPPRLCAWAGRVVNRGVGHTRRGYKWKSESVGDRLASFFAVREGVFPLRYAWTEISRQR